MKEVKVFTSNLKPVHISSGWVCKLKGEVGFVVCVEVHFDWWSSAELIVSLDFELLITIF